MPGASAWASSVGPPRPGDHPAAPSHRMARRWSSAIAATTTPPPPASNSAGSSLPVSLVNTLPIGLENLAAGYYPQDDDLFPSTLSSINPTHHEHVCRRRCILETDSGKQKLSRGGAVNCRVVFAVRLVFLQRNFSVIPLKFC